MKTITVLYFASLAQQANSDQESLQVASDSSIADIYQLLQQRHGFDMPSDSLRVAINHDFANWQDAIADGDVLAFIPPVAGG